MVEGARLESVYRGNSIEGSNPSLSAIEPVPFQFFASQAGICAQNVPDSLNHRLLALCLIEHYVDVVHQLVYA